jgi:tRNA-splicing ligase RtcB
MELSKLKKEKDYEWTISRSGDMKVPAVIYASQDLMEEMDEKVYEQITNVASLPGIERAAIGMPDAHWGYGFPIGGVAAFDPRGGGVVSVGGVGFDVNCGVRTLKTDMKLPDIQSRLKEFAEVLFRTVPAGVGSRGQISLNRKEVSKVLVNGAEWVVQKGYGTKEDLEFTEDGGKVSGGNPDAVSETALKREKKQVGTLGSGNHYLEIQYVDEIYDPVTAKQFGMSMNQVVITIHCGSRALGHQVGTDYLKTLAEASRKYGIPIRERELVCAPIDSKEGKRYFSAVNCAINYAFANRQVICHLVRETFKKIFPGQGIQMLYDVGHNTCKVERHEVDGVEKDLYVHRKGATRAFGPGRKELTEAYRSIGQPVIVGGTMGTASYILVGTESGEEKAFASVCHGAGRRMSRNAAKKKFRGDRLKQELEERGILIFGHSMPGLAEEAPEAYKDVASVIEAIHRAGLARKVLRVRPLACIKG